MTRTHAYRKANVLERARPGNHLRPQGEAYGRECLCTPSGPSSYSPDFSPIELAFSKIKGRPKSLAARTKQALADAVAEACCTVNPVDVAGWFKHCGYGLQWFCNWL